MPFGRPILQGFELTLTCVAFHARFLRMAPVADSSQVLPRMIVAPVDVIDLSRRAYTHTVKSQFADPVCFLQDRQAYVLPVLWQSEASAG